MRRVIISQARVDPGLWTRFAQGSEGHLSVAVINRSEKRRREIRNGARAPTEAMAQPMPPIHPCGTEPWQYDCGFGAVR